MLNIEKKSFTNDKWNPPLQWSSRAGVDTITKFPGLVILLVDMFVWKYSTHPPGMLGGWVDFKAFYNKNMSPSTSSGQLPRPCEFYVYYICDICAPGDYIFPIRNCLKRMQFAGLHHSTLHSNFSFWNSPLKIKGQQVAL